MNLSPIAGSTPAPADPFARPVASSGSDDAATSSVFASLLAGALLPTPLLSALAPKLLGFAEDGVRAAAVLGADALRAGAKNEAVTAASKDGRAVSDLASSGDSTVSSSPNDAAAPLNPETVLGAAAAGLAPALQVKLARVVTRMREEFGRDVRVAEGVRSQGRQNQLFAQGRSTAGPVVTWTRNSLHASGRAADVMIDGGYDDASGFALLRQVAEQEGLHTLGARDPGHLELRGGRGAAARAADSPLSPALATTGGATGAPSPKVSTEVPFARPNLIAAVAPVARVATVAAVANVASVAGMTTMGAAAHVSPASAAPRSNVREGSVAVTAPGSNAGANGVAAAAQRDARNGDGAGGQSSAGDGNRHDRTGATAQKGSTPRHAGADAYGAIAPQRGASDGSVEPAVELAPASTLASRIDRAMDAQDAPGPRSLTHLTLSLDDGNGGQERVRIGMRGASVGASFEMRDTASADRVSSRLGELTRALEQRGLEPDSFQVRSAAPAVRADADATRSVAASGGTVRDVAESAAMRHESRPDMGSDARHRSPQQDDQQERARQRLDEQRRRGSVFTLADEDK